MIARYEESQSIATARLMTQSEALRAPGRVRFMRFEQAVSEALCQIWPKKERRARLRTVAMVSVGVLRLAVDDWLEQDGKRPLAKYIQEACENLRAEI